MPKKKTHEEFIKELSIINPDIEALEQYINTDTKIKVKCKICGHIWYVRPSDLLRSNKTGCPKCSAKKSGVKRTKSHEQFEKELYETNLNIKILGRYVNNHTKIKVRCKICGHVWDATPNSLTGKNHSGCPICSIKIQSEKRSKPHDVYVCELKNINPDIEVLGKYVNIYTKIKVKCKVCGHIWYANPNDLIGKNATGCPNCNISKGEKTVKIYLESQNVKFEPQKTFEGLLGIGGGLLSYDFYLPNYNLLIEYQGAFHDGSIKTGFQTPYKLKKQQEHDRRKRCYAKEHNIDLLEIWYWDFGNIEQILNKKLHIIGNQKST